MISVYVTCKNKQEAVNISRLLLQKKVIACSNIFPINSLYNWKGKLNEASMAIAEAVKLCRPLVIPMYPITPQTHIVERLADFISDGDLDAEMIHTESEHSAISAAIGASATGVRAFTATASQGLALMHEVLFIASGLRMPIVMAVANRTLSSPINIWNDQQDSISERD